MHLDDQKSFVQFLGIFITSDSLIRKKLCDAYCERKVTITIVQLQLAGYCIMYATFTYEVGFAVMTGSDSSPRGLPCCSCFNQDPGVPPGTTADSS